MIINLINEKNIKFRIVAFIYLKCSTFDTELNSEYYFQRRKAVILKFQDREFTRLAIIISIVHKLSIFL